MKAGLSAAFANAASRRNPTTGEISGGFPCGPADIELFNEVVYRDTQIGIEITNVLTAAGITPDDGDLTQLLQALDGLYSPVAPRNTLVLSSAGTSTWVVPAGITKVFARVWGAGGGGGGVGTGGGGAAGGAGGGYSEKLCSVTPGASISVTRGAAGTGGSFSGGGGGNGGTSSFGAFCSATGGGGGGGASSGGVAAVNGNGGDGIGGDVNMSGVGANQGLTIGGDTVGSAGGGAFCAATVVALSTSTGNGASYPGGGGGGGGGSVAHSGAPGSPGLVIIQW